MVRLGVLTPFALLMTGCAAEPRTPVWRLRLETDEIVRLAVTALIVTLVTFAVLRRSRSRTEALSRSRRALLAMVVASFVTVVLLGISGLVFSRLGDIEQRVLLTAFGFAWGAWLLTSFLRALDQRPPRPVAWFGAVCAALLAVSMFVGVWVGVEGYWPFRLVATFCALAVVAAYLTHVGDSALSVRAVWIHRVSGAASLALLPIAIYAVWHLEDVSDVVWRITWGLLIVWVGGTFLGGAVGRVQAGSLQCAGDQASMEVTASDRDVPPAPP